MKNAVVEEMSSGDPPRMSRPRGFGNDRQSNRLWEFVARW